MLEGHLSPVRIQLTLSTSVIEVLNIENLGARLRVCLATRYEADTRNKESSVGIIRD